MENNLVSRGGLIINSTELGSNSDKLLVIDSSGEVKHINNNYLVPNDLSGYALISDIPNTPTLQKVTDTDNTTTNSVTIGNSLILNGDGQARLRQGSYTDGLGTTVSAYEVAIESRHPGTTGNTNVSQKWLADGGAVFYYRGGETLRIANSDGFSYKGNDIFHEGNLKFGSGNTDMARGDHGHSISDITNLQTTLNGKSDNHDHPYLPLSGGALNNDATLAFRLGNVDIDFLKVDYSTAPGTLGFFWRYTGVATGNDNGLELHTSSNRVYRVTQDGVMSFSSIPKIGSSNIAKVSDIPSLSGYATQSWVGDQNYLTSLPSHSHSQDEINFGTGVIDIDGTGGSGNSIVGGVSISSASSSSNFPTSYFTVLTAKASDSRTFQIGGTSSGSFYMRSLHTTNNNTWRELWHSGNSDSFNSSGTYSGLRAQATTKTDVGLSNVTNNTQVRLSDRSDGYLWIRRTSVPFFATNQSGGDIARFLQGSGDGTIRSRVANNGTMYAPDFVGTSDIRKKENIELYKPKEIKTTYKIFNFIDDKDKQERLGVIAQELEVNHPEFVRTDDDGIKSVSYNDLHSAEIAYLKNKVDKQEEMIETQQSQIEELKAMMKQLLGK